MKQTIKDWLVQSPRVQGVLAFGVRFPDKTTLSESYSASFPGAALENTWRCVADTCQVLALHRIPAARMQWIYDHVVLHAVRRNDGIICGLFTARNEDELDAAGVESLLAELQALRSNAG